MGGGATSCTTAPPSGSENDGQGDGLATRVSAVALAAVKTPTLMTRETVSGRMACMRLRGVTFVIGAAKWSLTTISRQTGPA